MTVERALNREHSLEFRILIADSLDRRRKALTETMRVVVTHKNTPLHHRACAMAIPMIYAIWEGFAKEALQLYVEYLAKSAVEQREVRASLLAYSWSGAFKKLSNNVTHEKKVELIERFLRSLTDSLSFEKAEREIDTKSNLMFEVLKELASFLCLDISQMNDQSKNLNALVNRRNHIAHGGREQQYQHAEIEAYRNLVQSLMESLENVLGNAVESQSFRRA